MSSTSFDSTIRSEKDASFPQNSQIAVSLTTLSARGSKWIMLLKAFLSNVPSKAATMTTTPASANS